MIFVRRILPVAVYTVLILAVAAVLGHVTLSGYFPRRLDTPPGEFLLLCIEARTVFDSHHAPLDGLSHPEWTGDLLISEVSVSDRLMPPPARILYRVKAPEDVVAGELTSVRDVPQTLKFPLQRSHFSQLILLVRSISAGGEVFLELSGEPFQLGPGQQRRIGGVREPSGGLTTYWDPHRWQDRLEEALVLGEPAVVLVVHNVGWVQHRRVKSPEEVFR